MALGLFTVPYYGYGRTLYGHFTGTFTRQPYRIKKLKNTERYGTGKKNGYTAVDTVRTCDSGLFGSKYGDWL